MHNDNFFFKNLLLNFIIFTNPKNSRILSNKKRNAGGNAENKISLFEFKRLVGREQKAQQTVKRSSQRKAGDLEPKLRARMIPIEERQ